jgi:hypothetical protein
MTQTGVLRNYAPPSKFTEYIPLNSASAKNYTILDATNYSGVTNSKCNYYYNFTFTSNSSKYSDVSLYNPITFDITTGILNISNK